MTTLIAAALASICVIGPVPFHRFVFRRGMKDDLIQASTRYVASGLVFIFMSMIGAVLLAVDVLVSRPIALTTAAAISVVFVLLWLVIPIRARIEEEDDRQDSPYPTRQVLRADSPGLCRGSPFLAVGSAKHGGSGSSVLIRQQM